MQFCLYACTSTEEDHMSEIPFIKNENIQFYGDQSVRNDAIKLLDRVLKEQGDFGSYGNLSGGIDDIKKDMNIKITEEEYYYSIDIYPESSFGGHDFGFTIDKITGKRSDVAVGEILPPPEFDQ